jgi:hypothetical protein
MTNTNITIPINRKRFPSVLIIGLLLTVLLGYSILNSDPIQFVMDDILSWIFKTFLFGLVSFYTCVALASYIKVVFDKNAKLMITDNSLIDTTSIFSCGEILWTDIVEVNLRKGFNMQYLMLKIKDPQKFVANKNFLKRYFLENRIKKIGTPLLISETHLNCNIDVLRDIILEHINK